jgi:hypothetical protein
MTFSDPTALNAEITQNQANATAASSAATDATNATNAQNESTFQSALANAVLQGTNNVNQYFTDNGLDPSKYAPQITNAINTAKSSVTDLNPNPMSAFPTTLGAQIVNQLTAGQQAKNTGAVNAVFSPTYAQDAIPLSSDQGAISSVLDNQFNPLSAELTNAQKRGTLNDVGYSAALSALGNSKTAATSTLNTLGSGIINNDRSALDNYISGAKTAASSATLNDPAFDPSKYATEAQTMTASDLGNMTGDLQNAVGSTSFADLPSLLNAGGSVQGATDPTASNPNGAVGPGGAAIGGGVNPSYIADQVLANTKRGLGTTGAF